MATTMNKVEYIKSLGWVFEEYWNNRAIYGLGKNSDCPYALFEHQGEVGIVYNGKFNYYNLSEDDIKEFTKTLNTRELIMHNPDKYKVSDLFDACKAIDDILNDFAIRKLKEDNENFSNNKEITMAIIKSYTSLEQSKKLAEILPLESADMKWYFWKNEIDAPKTPTFGYSKFAAETYNNSEAVYLPCWSLASLLGVLPEGTKLLKSSNISSVSDIKYFCDCPKCNVNKWFDNPVDACVEIILELYEHKIL